VLFWPERGAVGLNRWQADGFPRLAVAAIEQPARQIVFMNMRISSISASFHAARSISTLPTFTCAAKG
jgi:hypothetical protein